ncbi:tetratricopeptide repeat protein [Flavobacterium okayamense]|uniref:Cytochrome c biosynthesis protein n=1 Tax=Flavobacterium okayamense TaxID=2830782 RepID=A0ABM7S369_9FLAO|nr:tetratricopeptide repeat protein [Flavobacterium okayamense]BCY27961.1 cytochrome c biosynthesis protein [Flavobacterium okayamense]
MRYIKSIQILIFLFSIGTQTTFYAQTNPDDIALVDDFVENNFYDAIKQRAIENYDKAIIAIQKCIDKQPNTAAFHYELGKNYLDSKQYAEAEQAFQKATELDPSQRWYWNGLYDVYYATKDYQKSIKIVQKLIEFDEHLKEDLVSLYVYTNQKDKALQLIEEIESKAVLSANMEYYKLRLLEDSKSNKDERALITAIIKNPKSEQNYIDLMALYSQQNREDKAIEVAKDLAIEIPNSEWSSISLFKLYLNEDNGTAAANELLKVLENPKVTLGLKHRFLNEFLIYSANSTQYDSQLNRAVDILSDDKTINVAKEVAKFYYNKRNYEKTSFFLEKALANEPNDWESVDLLLDNLVNAKNYEELGNRAVIFIDLFPSQPKLYYFAGYAENKKQNYKQAIEYLETGLEFVVEDIALERYFAIQLAEAYAESGNKKKSDYYVSKVNELTNQLKK